MEEVLAFTKGEFGVKFYGQFQDGKDIEKLCNIIIGMKMVHQQGTAPTPPGTAASSTPSAPSALPVPAAVTPPTDAEILAETMRLTSLASGMQD